MKECSKGATNKFAHASVECWWCKRAAFISRPCCFGIDHVFCTVQIDLKEHFSDS